MTPKPADLTVERDPPRALEALQSPESEPVAPPNAIDITPSPKLWFEFSAVVCLAIVPDIIRSIAYAVQPAARAFVVGSAAVGLTTRSIAVIVPVLYIIHVSARRRRTLASVARARRT